MVSGPEAICLRNSTIGRDVGLRCQRQDRTRVNYGTANALIVKRRSPGAPDCLSAQCEGVRGVRVVEAMDPVSSRSARRPQQVARHAPGSVQHHGLTLQAHYLDLGRVAIDAMVPMTCEFEHRMPEPSRGYSKES